MIYVCHCYSHIFLSLLCAHTNGWANIDTHTCILRIRWNMYNVEKIICWKAGFEPWGCHDFYHLRWFNRIKVWSRGKWLDRISGFWPQVMQFRGFQWCSYFSANPSVGWLRFLWQLWCQPLAWAEHVECDGSRVNKCEQHERSNGVWLFQ